MRADLSKFVERIGDLIKEWEARGVKIDEIAENAGQNLCDLYHWKSPKNRYFPSLPQIIALADYFSCSVGYLIGVQDENGLFVKGMKAAEFGQRLKCVLTEKKMPIAVLARKANLANTSAIYNWINGKNLPRVDSLVAVCKVLDCMPDELLRD